MSDAVHTVPTVYEQMATNHEKAMAEHAAKRRAEEERKREEFLFRGIKSRSAARVSRSWEDEDPIHRIERTEEGLQFRVSDPDYLDRGRDHEIVVSYRLIEDVYKKRHGAVLAVRDARIAELEEQLLERETRLAEIETIAGAPRT